MKGDLFFMWLDTRFGSMVNEKYKTIYISDIAYKPMTSHFRDPLSCGLGQLFVDRETERDIKSLVNFD